MADSIPVAAAAAGNKDTARPIQHRTRRMSKWFKATVQGWIDQNEITELDVVLELPFLNDDPMRRQRGVTTLMTQMRMVGVYEEALFSLENCKVRLGEVSNSTAKMILTGNGSASKALMITYSEWNRRPDVTVREHLADAQGIGTCRPSVMVDMDDGLLLPTVAAYEDSAIGEGPQWKKGK